MPHVPAPTDVVGIRSLFRYRPETAEPLLQLAQTLLRGPSPLTELERELIAASVSEGNACRFCARSHAAAAAHVAEGSEALVASVLANRETAPITPKLRALLAIADLVRQDARTVTAADVALARERGATDIEIHDTVLIAAAFCMFNRYVDGLDAVTPDEPAAYREMGAILARDGYLKRR